MSLASVVLPPSSERRRPGWERGVMDSRGRQQSAAAPQIDPRYRSFDTSELSYTVTEDASQNQFDIQLDLAR